MNLRKQFEEETGLGAEIPSLIGEPVAFTEMYVEWLEKQVKKLNKSDVGGELVAFFDWLDTYKFIHKTGKENATEYLRRKANCFITSWKLEKFNLRLTTKNSI